MPGDPDLEAMEQQLSTEPRITRNYRRSSRRRRWRRPAHRAGRDQAALHRAPSPRHARSRRPQFPAGSSRCVRASDPGISAELMTTSTTPALVLCIPVYAELRNIEAVCDDNPHICGIQYDYSGMLLKFSAMSTWTGRSGHAGLRSFNDEDGISALSRMRPRPRSGRNFHAKAMTWHESSALTAATQDAC